MAPLHALNHAGRSVVVSVQAFAGSTPALRARAVLAMAMLAGAHVIVPDAHAQAHRIASPAVGLLEVGAPQYAVRNQEALGLNAPPTDLKRLPDGRMLVVAGRELAFGDGSRWEIFHQAADDPMPPAVSVAVDADGTIYMGVPAGFARVEFDDVGQWRLNVVQPWSTAQGSSVPALRYALQVGDAWFWHSGAGAVFTWRPGEQPRFRGRAETVEQVIRLGDDFFLSDRTNGRLWRLGESKMEQVMHAAGVSVSETLTCAVPLGDDELLVGTYARGLQIFDGRRTRPFSDAGVLTGNVRVNDVCATEGGMFAAAIEGVGIVFFDSAGRTVQVLDRALDHHLSQIRRLVPTSGGVIWGQLDDGVLRMEFPSRISNFEPLIGSGLAVAHPDRLDGRLWLLADGRVYRGVYDADGRLVELEPDTPEDRFAFAFSCAPGRPVVGTNRGAFYRDDTGWKEFFPLSANLRILSREPVDGRWLYGAVGEVGWLRPTADGIEVERIPVGGLGNLYNAVTCPDGTIWLELGHSQAARVQLHNGQPAVEFFDRQAGLPEGWVNIFCIGPTAGFNVEGQILRFDEATHHFLPDETFARDFPGVEHIIGRPARDARGRVWISAAGVVHVYERNGDTWREVDERMPAGFQPNFFTAEPDGVMWMHAERRLARYDPTMPVVAPVPLEAVFTHVTLPGSGRTIFAPADNLPPFPYEDSSFVAHFAAAGNPFSTPVRFEVLLEGAGDIWIPAGGGGAAAFNRLNEGEYRLRVRPRTGTEIGREASLTIKVLPPWYRTTAAYVGYAVGFAVCVMAIIWIGALVARREKQRLCGRLARRLEEVEELTARLERAEAACGAGAPAAASPAVDRPGTEGTAGHAS